ncbi:MAG: IS21-like element helper ATPase IstB [Beduini sp.]
MSIKESAGILKLPFIKNNYEECIKEALLNDWNYEEFLEKILNQEIHVRKQNSINNRIRNACFPYKIILDDYKREHLSIEIRQKIKELETLEFLDNNENIILIGNPGTGKTALSIALGMKSCLSNKNVLFVNASNLLIELKEAMTLNQINKYKTKFEKYDLVIVDELGYCSFDKERGEILFNLLSSRNQKGATIITSNLSFDRWNEIFNDSVLAGAIIDRLAYKSHLINMTGDSYRIIATKEWNEKHK